MRDLKSLRDLPDLPLWICCQLGAREHYAIPRVLNYQQNLSRFITDVWVRPQSLLNKLPKSCFLSLRDRFHQDLKNYQVESFNNSVIGFELIQKFKNKCDWSKIIDRNLWFQKKVVSTLDKESASQKQPINIFAYSYAALDIFKFAKSKGWRTILGQIDPGIFEEKLVISESKKYYQYQPTVNPIPQDYWNSWQQECSLADTIIVNSPWSKEALQKTGILGDKIKVVPLAYNPPAEVTSFTRFYPSSFSKDRPLRILFLGQIILRKGIAAIFKAIELLKNEPVEFWFVGSIGVIFPDYIQNNYQVKIIGKVPRSLTANYYKQADIFLFPTLSDGFGLTQLEAQAWQLPIISSQFCGAVVKNQINGLILPNVTGQAISSAINYCFKNPQRLTEFSQNSQNILEHFSLSKLSHNLQRIETINC